jgi:hypothetical protein
MAQLEYVLTFKGAASDTLAAAFDGAELITRSGVTTLRTAVLDQAELQGVIGRIHALGLELLEVRLEASPAEDDHRWISGP